MPRIPHDLASGPASSATAPHQDLAPVVFHNAVATIKNRTGPTKTLIATRSGSSGKNVQHATQARRLTKLDNDTTAQKVKPVARSFAKALMQARVAKGMTQKALAQAVCVKPQALVDFERGKQAPASAVINKLNRTLGVQLPRTRG